MVSFSELELSRKIGYGAAGSVWRGSWRGAAVAVKVRCNRCVRVLFPVINYGGRFTYGRGGTGDHLVLLTAHFRLESHAVTRPQ